MFVWLTEERLREIADMGWTGATDPMEVGGSRGLIVDRDECMRFLAEHNLIAKFADSGYEGISIMSELRRNPPGAMTAPSMFMSSATSSGGPSRSAVSSILSTASAPAPAASGASGGEVVKKKMAKPEEKPGSKLQSIVACDDYWDGDKEVRGLILAATGEILGDTFPTVRIEIPHGEARKSTNVTDSLVIYVWSSPEDAGMVDTPEKIFGIKPPIPSRDQAFKPSGQGLEIKDKDGFCAAEFVSPNSLYITFDAIHKTKAEVANTVNLWVAVLVEMLARLDKKTLKDFQKGIEIKKQQIMKAKIEAFINSTRDSGLKNKQAELEKTLAMITDHVSKLSNFIRRRNTLVNELDFLQQSGSEETQVSGMVDSILANRYVTGFDFAHSKLIVRTVPLTVVDPRTQFNHMLGRFRIEIDCANSYLRIFNEDRKVNGLNTDQQAPHVFASGEACWGNMQEALPALYADHDYLSIINVVLVFLQSVNVNDGAGGHVFQWPVINEDGSLTQWSSRKKEEQVALFAIMSKYRGE